jgi:hypothetical protein
MVFFFAEWGFLSPHPTKEKRERERREVIGGRWRV